MKGHADRTCYGNGRAAPRDFLTHHTRALSIAIATAVGDAITMHASIVKSRLAAPPLTVPSPAWPTSGASPKSEAETAHSVRALRSVST